MEGSVAGNVQEVPQMEAESKMEIEEPKVGGIVSDKGVTGEGKEKPMWDDIVPKATMKAVVTEAKADLPKSQ